MFCLAHWSNNRASYRGTVSNTCAVILCGSVYVCLSRGGWEQKKKEKKVLQLSMSGLLLLESGGPGCHTERIQYLKGKRERERMTQVGGGGNNKARPLGTNSLRSVKCTTGRKRCASGLAGERVCLGGLQCAH